MKTFCKACIIYNIYFFSNITQFPVFIIIITSVFLENDIPFYHNYNKHKVRYFTLMRTLTFRFFKDKTYGGK